MDKGKRFVIKISCCRSQLQDWAVDLVGADAAAGKAMLALVISAKLAGKNFHVYGKGTCDVWGDRGTVEYIIVE